MRLDSRHHFEGFDPQMQTIEFNILLVEHIKEINQDKISLQESFYEFLKTQDLLGDLKVKIAFDYAKYMAILARQLIVNITMWQDIDFNPQIASPQINKGIWMEPLSLRYELIFTDSLREFSKNHLILNAIGVF